MDPARATALTCAEARRIALAAQGFASARDAAPPSSRRLRGTAVRLGVLQIDSVNVLVRSHFLPLFSRLGAYDRRWLECAAYGGRRRALFEYWGHEASLLPVALEPLLRWRMARAARGVGIYPGLARWARRKRAFVAAVLAEVTARGPLAASELSLGGRARGSWWGWSDGKRALEWLFWAGRVTTATRRGFERVYDLPERALPAAVLATPTPAEADAQRALLLVTARALGVATARELADYFRLAAADTRPRLEELVEAAALVPVRVDGWKDLGYMPAGTRAPRAVTARALLSPFDSLVFERRRTERLFGFHYRLALYTPAARRTHGYYVLPFLLGDRLVARVDVKADRAARVLRVLSAHAEVPSGDGGRASDRGEIAAALHDELDLMRGWLALDAVTVSPTGDLGRVLAPR